MIGPGRRLLEGCTVLAIRAGQTSGRHGLLKEAVSCHVTWTYGDL